ncbi:MAG: hypothetical protein IAF02_24905, partial [Anaerolineae bacterium]|nr:hypothetical protein [Anaerolineae bacterium]
MKKKRSTLFAWLYFAVIALFAGAGLVLRQATLPDGTNLIMGELLLPVVIITFAFVGALIISRRPRNAIGLLMMLPGTSLVVFVDAYIGAFSNGFWSVPEQTTPLLLLMVLVSNWNWLLLVFPLMFIMVLFPTGRPLSRRWGWLLYFGLGLALLIVGITTISDPLMPGSGADWSVTNPIGFADPATIEATPIFTFFFIALPLWVFLCAVSLFVRFRRANAVERSQIKWLFFAVGLFVVSYIPSFFAQTFNDSDIWNVIWLLGMLSIPVAIAIAILRYHLYDIDLIIRKTAVYTVLTAVLALVYFGTVILLQSLIGQATGEQSPLIIVLSTLLIAALFTPLRQRIQAVIDRRFFRKKYDAQ